MKDRLKWIDDFGFIGETASGHALIMDGGLEHGGRNRGARPMELLLHGAAGCMSYDIIAILKNSKEDIRDLWIDIDKTQAESSPKVYTAINFHIVITGKSIKNESVERAIKLASEKYCSASIMLGKTAKMSYTYEIREQN
ncbi:OsmC family protein [Frischella perrara]|jgi:Predicted redox protein, regulator of disulfide bond formation|uniref:Osmotically inducible protein C n=1 Tax=Frischella perrara TaxID=1267021 RepID=A0A0A7S065_FRIPE|nr:OsmC family protein [Frischella perrara]AJA44267.1 putative redox protein, regulator of disulfide bond formation [Frischella perrara]MCT6874639.1 OsmC family protein [Frischella perrara]PWV63953.1 putative redox protein [Frischella perrara]PXY96597.1 osmotically inducible protein C [Frischella perrara]